MNINDFKRKIIQKKTGLSPAKRLEPNNNAATHTACKITNISPIPNQNPQKYYEH